MTTTLNTIHVTLTINGASVKRPLRVYNAKTNTFGVMLKGECHAVMPTGVNTVALVKGAMPRAKLSCRAAKLADLGIVAKPVPAFIAERKARKAQADEAPAMPVEALKLTPELVAQMIAMLQNHNA